MKLLFSKNRIASFLIALIPFLFSCEQETLEPVRNPEIKGMLSYTLDKSFTDYVCTDIIIIPTKVVYAFSREMSAFDREDYLGKNTFYPVIFDNSINKGKYTHLVGFIVDLSNPCNDIIEQVYLSISIDANELHIETLEGSIIAIYKST